MKLHNALIAVAFSLPLVSAWPALAMGDSLEPRQTDPNPFIPASGSDVRSPCPGTNTLANHGFINRNGRNITAAAYIQGFMDAFGMSNDSVFPGATNAINLCSSETNTTCTAFDLNMLSKPHVIEHDASMTRLDKELKNNQNANNQVFSSATWQRTKAILAQAPTSLSSNGTYVVPQISNTLRLGRVAQAKLDDYPGWFKQNIGGSLTEQSFILFAMGDPTVATRESPMARQDWLNYWMNNQRLPTDLGWSKNTMPVSTYIGELVQMVNSAGTYSATGTTSTTTTTKVAVKTTTTTTKAPVPTSTKTTTTNAGGSSLPTSPPKVMPVVKNIIPERAADMLISSLPPVLDVFPASAVSEAKASATAAAGPTPNVPNLYDLIYSPAEMGAFAGDIRKFVIKQQTVFLAELNRLVNDTEVARP